MVKMSVITRLFPPSVMMVLAMVSPKPVFEVTPMMMPTQAQAMATATVWVAPSANASQMSLKLIRVLFLNPATTMVATMVITAEKTTVVPEKSSK